MTDTGWVAGLILLGQSYEIQRMGELAAEPWKCQQAAPKPSHGLDRRRRMAACAQS